MPDRAEHWETLYVTKHADTVSWYQPAPAPSLDAQARITPAKSKGLIDVGGGASNLVDALLERGWRDLAVLDIAQPALDVARARLGERADDVEWIAADITTWRPERRYAIWHDRAVFHFLTEAADRAGYRAALEQGLAPGGALLMATFALGGPERCSGLSIVQYGPESLSAELGEAFSLQDSWREDHVTPGGGVQAFNRCLFRKTG
ncbi:class I SAM-dependent methyltransferase [Caulobacter sp. DWP3-1-3b2]|uniref:class I SAM-dependent methyltransferase n=1 Tax=Caulobacter sp. DWP3-1-3b2 TaxID=2804643 RepID=UPI003CF2478B